MATKDISDYQVVAVVAYWRSTEDLDAVEFLESTTGEPPKVCLRALERADRRGLIDWGTTIRRPFLTDKGRELLAAGENRR